MKWPHWKRYGGQCAALSHLRNKGVYTAEGKINNIRTVLAGKVVSHWNKG